MTSSSEDPTSKFPRRLYRDIILSNDIGRPTNNDPFASRDMTRLFGDPKNVDRGLQQLCFAEKPITHRAPSPVDLQRTTGRNRGPNWTAKRSDCDGDYTIPPLRDIHSAQSIPQGWRWKDDLKKNVAQSRKEIYEKQQTMRLENDLARRAAKRQLQSTPREEGGGGGGDPFDAVEGHHQVLSHPSAATSGAAAAAAAAVPASSWFSRHSGRERSAASSNGRSHGNSNNNSKNQQQQQQSSRFAHLPWAPHPRTVVMQQQGGVVLKPQAEDNPANTSRPPMPPAARGAGTAAGRSEVTTAGTSYSAGEPSSMMGTSSPDIRDQMMVSNPLRTGGSNNNTTKSNKKHGGAAAKRGADFSRTSSRQAPLFFQVPAPVSQDILYHPSYEPTSRFRSHSADVRLARYSGRQVTSSPAPLLASAVHNILDFSNLVKFRETQKQKAKASVFALPVQEDDDDDDDEAQGNGGKHKKKRTLSAGRRGGGSGGNADLDFSALMADGGDQDAVPLAKAYDLDIHPESVIVPRMTPNGRIQGSPWLSLYAAREGTSVSQAVGRMPGSAPKSRAGTADKTHRQTEGL